MLLFFTSQELTHYLWWRVNFRCVLASCFNALKHFLKDKLNALVWLLDKSTVALLRDGECQDNKVSFLSYYGSRPHCLCPSRQCGLEGLCLGQFIKTLLSVTFFWCIPLCKIWAGTVQPQFKNNNNRKMQFFGVSSTYVMQTTGSVCPRL